MDGRISGWMGGWMDAWMDAWMSGQLVVWLFGARHVDQWLRCMWLVGWLVGTVEVDE